jgi:hypothetical protein
LSEERIVSCDDSTVDLYLSYDSLGGYSLLVPEDTDLKDVGSYRSVLDRVRFSPGDWAPNHAVQLLPDHVVVVWTYEGDFYLLQARRLEDKRASIECVWHSRLTRARAEEMETKAAEERRRKEGKRALGPWFGK